MDRRRYLLTSLAGVLAVPLAGEAQPAGKIYRIGTIWTTPTPSAEDTLRLALRELGWIEGQNFVFERRYSEGRNDRLPGLAAELVRLRPDLISTVGEPAALAARAATTTIPVVFTAVGDPVGSGIVESLARPGRNLTGTGSSGSELAGKWLELFKEAVPSLSRVGVFINSADPLHASERPIVETTGRRLGLALRYVEVRTPEDVDGAFAALARENLRAVLVLGQSMLFALRARLAKLALDQRVATMIPWREAVEAGALISYLEALDWHLRRGAYYIDRILKGAKPADLPVEQPTVFLLTINLKTAKALGLAIPPSLLARAGGPRHRVARARPTRAAPASGPRLRDSPPANPTEVPMDTLRTEFLCELSADLEAPQQIGATPHGTRRIIYVKGGAFEGPKLKGKVLPGGGDWLLVRPGQCVRTRYQRDAPDRRRPSHLRAVSRHHPRPTSHPPAVGSRRERHGPVAVLLPHHSCFRDRFGEIRMA